MYRSETVDCDWGRRNGDWKLGLGLRIAYDSGIAITIAVRRLDDPMEP